MERVGAVARAHRVARADELGEGRLEVTQLLAILDQAYNKPSWHGTNLRGSIRGLSPKQAAWRPAPKRGARLRVHLPGGAR